MKYLNSIGITSYIPPIPKVADDYVPYIFSDEELERIYLRADNLDVSSAKKNPLIQYEFPMVIRLMYGCGLRIGETLALKMKDVDLLGGILTMRHTKGDKQRLVPMNPLLTEILERYCLAIGIVGVPDAWLFPVFGKDESMTPKDTQHCFEKILRLVEGPFLFFKALRYSLLNSIPTDFFSFIVSVIHIPLFLPLPGIFSSTFLF